MIRYRVVDPEARTVLEFHADNQAAAVKHAWTFAENDIMQGAQRRALRLLEEQETDWVVIDVLLVGGHR